MSATLGPRGGRVITSSKRDRREEPRSALRRVLSARRSRLGDSSLRMGHCFLSFTLAACAHTSFEPLDLATLPDGKKYPGDHRVHLVDEQRVRFFADPQSKEAVAEVEVH